MEHVIARLDRIEEQLSSNFPAIPQREFLNINEAATFIGMSRQTLDKWRMQGTGPAVHRVGRRVLYSVSDLRNFMQANKCETLK